MTQTWWSSMLEQLRKDFGARLKALRKQRNWTQKRLSGKVGIRFTQLNKYEGGFQSPPLDTLVKLADALDTTVDYLLTGNRTEGAVLHNHRLLERFEAMQSFQTEDQEAVLRLIDAMIVKHRVEGALAPIDRRAS